MTLSPHLPHLIVQPLPLSQPFRLSLPHLPLRAHRALHPTRPVRAARNLGIRTAQPPIPVLAVPNTASGKLVSMCRYCVIMSHPCLTFCQRRWYRILWFGLPGIIWPLRYCEHLCRLHEQRLFHCCIDSIVCDVRASPGSSTARLVSAWSCTANSSSALMARVLPWACKGPAVPPLISSSTSASFVRWRR